MQITIYLREESLEELANFLAADIKYEHTVEYFTNQAIGFTLMTQVQIYYSDFVALQEWAMKSTEHPYYPKESRTKEQ